MAATLSVFKFPAADGAGVALAKLQGLQKQNLIQIQDAAIVSWPADKKKPNTQQLHNLAGAGALNGAFWGMLFGLLFFVPLLGAAIGAGMGALTGHMVDLGIDDNFIKETRDQVTPGTSALFLLSSGAVQDRVLPEFQDMGIEVVATNLSEDEEAKLKAAFADE